MKTIILSACLLVLLAGCNNQQQTSQNQSTSNNQVNQQQADTTNGWQKFNYQAGVSVSIPNGWRNMGPEDSPIFTDAKENIQIHVSFHGDEPAFDSTGKQVIENILSSALDKDTKITSNQVLEWVKEDLILGGNTVYKVYRPENQEDSSYYIRLKNNAGFIEFYVAKYANDNIIKSILEKVEVY